MRIALCRKRMLSYAICNVMRAEFCFEHFIKLEKAYTVGGDQSRDREGAVGVRLCRKLENQSSLSAAGGRRYSSKRERISMLKP